MELTVNKVKIEIDENGFEENLYGTGCPGISITAIAPDGRTRDCYWWYKETAEDSGIYKFADCACDGENPGHEDFKAWLKQVTGCDDDDAIAAMTKILNNIDKSDEFSSVTSELVELYNNASTALVLDPGTQLFNQSAEIYITAGGRYLGVIFDCKNIHYIVEMTREKFEKCKIEVCENLSDDYERFTAVYDAIMMESHDE